MLRGRMTDVARTPQRFQRDRVAGFLLILALPMLVAGLVTPLKVCVG